MARKHQRNFAPEGENQTYEAEAGLGDATPPSSKCRRRVLSPTGASAGSPVKTSPSKTEAAESEARRLWREADAVCFDVDSTVCVDEAIDELATFCGVGSEVADWTRRAMSEGLSFRRALTERLALIRPTRLQLEEFCKSHPPRLTPGVEELVSELQRRQRSVYLVSGGFTRIILDVAAKLGVPGENVHANVLHFDEEGAYAGFDESQPTSDSGGKTEVARMLKHKFRYNTLVMVGDGATDMEAAPPADTFVGFGANQVRQKVLQGAPWFVYSFQTLLHELNNHSYEDNNHNNHN